MTSAVAERASAVALPREARVDSEAKEVVVISSAVAEHEAVA
jgi:hypothetical protein